MAEVASLQTAIMGVLDNVVTRVLGNDRDVVSVPAGGLAVVGMPTAVEYDATFARGADTYTFTIRVLSGRQSERAAETRLAEFISGTGTSSVKAAFQNNDTLGGAAQTARIASAGQLGSYAYGEVEYLGVEFTLEVIA